MSVRRVRSTDVQSLIRLLGDVRTAGQPAEQGRLLVDVLCRLVDADAGWFVESVRQGEGWVPTGFGAGSVLDDRLVRYMQQWGREFPIQFDMMATHIIADGRPAFVERWHRVQRVAPRDRLAPFADLVGTIGVADMADPVFALNADHRFALNLQRIGTARRRFDRRELDLMQIVATELKWLHETGRLHLSALTRDPPPPPLPPRLQQVLDGLLNAESPKQIARRLGLSIHTVREHVQRLYRHLGVSGRDELMARFVGRPNEPDRA